MNRDESIDTSLKSEGGSGHRAASMPVPSMPMYEDEIDLREYIAVLWKWRWLIATVTLISVLTAGVLSFFVLQPVYEASVQILASREGPPYEVITSPYFLERVTEKLGLQHDERYTPFALARAVTVQAGKSANLTVIKIQDRDPELASKIVNAIAELYVEFVREKNSETVSETVSYLTSQRQQAEKALDAAKTDLNNLRHTGQIDALQREVDRLAAKTTEYKSILTSGEVRQKELQKGIEELEKLLAATPKTVPGPLDYAGRPTEVPNQTYQELEQTIALKRVELTELEVRMEETRQMLPSVEAAYSSNYEKLLSLQKQAQDLELLIERLNTQIASLDAKVVEASSTLPETTIAAPALVPQEPVKPRKLLNMTVAGVLGGFVSVFMAFFIEYWRAPRRPAAHIQT